LGLSAITRQECARGGTGGVSERKSLIEELLSVPTRRPTALAINCAPESPKFWFVPYPRPTRTTQGIKKTQIDFASGQTLFLNEFARPLQFADDVFGEFHHFFFFC
jgi:hypothetical protein